MDREIYRYNTPKIISMPIVGGNLEWMGKEMRKRKFVIKSAYDDYEAHTWQGDKFTIPVVIKVFAYNYRHAIILANIWMRRQTSSYRKYRLLPVPPKVRR